MEKKPSQGLQSAETVTPEPKSWWNHENFPYSAPWWLRYPVGFGVVYGAFAFGFQSDRKAGWFIGLLFSIIALGLLRELFFGIALALLVGGGLYAVGAAIAALPVSVAIIIGAMIIANSGKR
jgi:hypothetical protein